MVNPTTVICSLRFAGVCGQFIKNRTHLPVPHPFVLKHGQHGYDRGLLSSFCVSSTPCGVYQVELDQEKGLEMRKWVLSGILASEETYISQLEALLIVRLIQVTFISMNYSLSVRWPHFGKNPLSLSVSNQPMKPLRAAATTSQPMLTIQQIETIFFKVPELHEIHKDFYDGLLPRVQDWGHQQCVGDLFQKLVLFLNYYYLAGLVVVSSGI